MIKMEILLQLYFLNNVIINFHNLLNYTIMLIILLVYLYQYYQIIILDFTFILFIIIYTINYYKLTVFVKEQSDLKSNLKTQVVNTHARSLIRSRPKLMY